MLDTVENSQSVDVTTLFSAANVGERRRAEAWFASRLRTAASNGIFSEEVELSPVLAELFLENNPDNRKIKHSVVRKFSTDICEGSWDLNGEAIKISKEGLMNDGQHRCTAVVATGRSIQVLVTFGVARGTRMTLDQNTGRILGDYLGMEGVTSANASAAIASLLWQYEHYGRVSNHSDDRPTKSQAHESFRTHPGIEDSIRAVSKKGNIVLGGITCLGFCHYVLTRKNEEHAMNFFEKLLKGDDLSANNPIFVCRERLLNNRKMKTGLRAELIFNAWNATFKKRGLSLIKANGGLLPKLETGL